MRKLFTFLAATGLAAGVASSPAHAQTKTAEPPATDKADKTMDKAPAQNATTNRRIAFVDLYLGEAIMGAKALSTLADGTAGKPDTALIGEARSGLDAAIEKAQSHAKAMKAGMKSADSAKIAELDQHLRDARDASKRLSGAKTESLTPAVDAVATQLMAARDSFRELARQVSYTPLDQQNLGTMPVKGSTPANPDHSTTAPSPATTKPATPPPAGSPPPRTDSATPTSPGQTTGTPSPAGAQPNEDKKKTPDDEKSPVLTPAHSDQPPPPKSP